MGGVNAIFWLIWILLLAWAVGWFITAIKENKLEDRIKNCEAQLRGITESLRDCVEVLERLNNDGK